MRPVAIIPVCVAGLVSCLQGPGPSPDPEDGAQLSIAAMTPDGQSVSNVLLGQNDSVLLIAQVTPSTFRKSIILLEWSVRGIPFGNGDTLLCTASIGDSTVIVLSAQDSEGNSARDSIRILVNTPPEFLDFHQPDSLRLVDPESGDGIWFRWSAIDPDANDTLLFTWILSHNGADVDTVQTSDAWTVYAPLLESGSSYQWRVLARDSHGAVSESPIYGFMTKSGSSP